MHQANELRLFVSSTFRDMQEEREYLVKKIFPEIRSICRRRGVVFTEIDLRWGLTEEEGALGRVIRTCLEEVDRCRPYFIGIIGDRYGWVPEYYEVMMDPDLLARYPWVEEAVIEGRSVTDMEFTHGVFNPDHDLSDNRAAYFYRRIEGNSEPDHPERLEGLIGRIEAAGLPFRDFAGLEALGRSVREDLLGVIDHYWPEEEAPSDLEVERRGHAAFAASRRRAYILNPKVLGTFRSWLKEGEKPLVITGASGLGKSSLMAYLAESMRTGSEARPVIEHYVGASHTSGSAGAVMRHVIDEIADLLPDGPDLPSDPEKLPEVFSDRLAALGETWEERGLEMPVLLIDAVNQLGERGRRLEWLPKVMPEGVRLIISTTPGESEDRLLERGWQRLDVEPIEDPGIRKSIIVRYLGEFHKGITAAQLDALANDPKASSPLYLRLVAEELRLHGEHETLAEEIDRYTGAETIDDVFQLVLARLETDYGRDHVADLLGLLHTSRTGLTETELAELIAGGRMQLSHLLFALDYHLVRKEGVLDFFHDYLRRGVEQRYIPDEETRNRYRLRIAEEFARLVEEEYRPGESVPIRLAREVCHQFCEAEAFDRLAESLVTLPIFTSLYHNHGEYDLLSYWKSVDDEERMYTGYATALAELRRTSRDISQVVEVTAAIGFFYNLASRFDAALPLLKKVYRYRRATEGERSPATAAAADALAEVLYHLGDYGRAKRLWSGALATLEEIYGEDDPRLCSLLDSLGTVCYMGGELEQWEEYCRRALRVSEMAYGREHPESIDRLVNLGEVHIVQGDLKRAIPVLENAVRISELAFGKNHPKVGKYLAEYGYALSKAKEYVRAEEVLLRAKSIIEKGMGEHLGLVRVEDLLGHLAIWTDRPIDAEKHYRRSYEVRRRLQGEANPYTLRAYMHVASAMRRQGKLEEAEEMVRRTLPLQVQRFGFNHNNVEYGIELMKLILEKMGREGEFENFLALLEEAKPSPAAPGQGV